MRWRLTPAWQKVSKSLINARAEPNNLKHSFSQAILSRRCIVIANGYFEF
jgi:putative SOS response-associated peptidase YedK